MTVTFVVERLFGISLYKRSFRLALEVKNSVFSIAGRFVVSVNKLCNTYFNTESYRIEVLGES